MYKCVLIIINVGYEVLCEIFCLLFMEFIIVITITILPNTKAFLLKEYSYNWQSSLWFSIIDVFLHRAVEWVTLIWGFCDL